MENERIFVIVPVYKVEPYLERCIDSILNQTDQNFELVLVDDGSPDNCPAICDRYAAEHENITVIHQENGGLSAARNTGIEYALNHGDPENDWINFIDSDDFVHPKYLEYLYRAAKEARVEISSCRSIRAKTAEVTPSGPDIMNAEIFSPEEFYCKGYTNAIVAWGKLYRVKLFENIRYPVGRLFEDNFTTYKLLFQQNKIAVIWNQLYWWYINPDSITGSAWNPHKIDALDALEEQYDFLTKNHFYKARSQVTREMLWHSIKQLMYVKHYSPKYDGYTPELKKRRNRAFRLYAEEVGLSKAIGYWYEVRIKSPLKRVLGKESLFSFLKRRIKKMLHIH